MAKKRETSTLEEKLQNALLTDREQPYKVPDNWVWTFWGQIGSFTAGNGFKKEFQGFQGNEIPFYKVRNLKYSNNRGYLYDTRDTITEEMRKELKATLIAPNSIIFAKIGEAIRLNRRSLNESPCCIDNNLMSFQTNHCNIRYIYFWSMDQDLYDLTNTTTIPSIRKSDLEIIPLPLPPLVEQERIVTRIESLFEKLDRAQDLLKLALDSIKTRKAAILNKAFNGELTAKWRKKNSIGIKSWSKKKFSDVAEIKSNLVDPMEYQNYPHIAPDNIEKRTGVLLDYHIIAEDKVTSVKNRFYPGQILYSKIRPNLSKVVIVDFDGLCSADMYPIEAKENTRYLWYYMLSDEFLNQATNAGSRSVLPKINQKELSVITVPMCTPEEQAEIVRILDNLFEKEQKAKDLVDVVNNIDFMKKAILASAFRGELGTNDPSEESAIELLKRIILGIMDNVSAQRPKSIRLEVSKVALTIMEELKKHDRLTPEQLKKEIQLDIDDFYEQIKKFTDDGLITEERENGDVYLEAVKNEN